jgi:hypothetical protein
LRAIVGVSNITNLLYINTHSSAYADQEGKTSMVLKTFVLKMAQAKAKIWR